MSFAATLAIIAFYERFGGKTIIFARFIPIIRTFAPFVAGIACMNSRLFFFYNLISAVLWIGILLYVSYFFGNLPVIKENFSLMVFLVIIISVLPAVIAVVRKKWFS